MIKIIHKNFNYIPIKKINQALANSKIPIEEGKEIHKENLTRYYNQKMLNYLKYQQWLEFFYLYESSTILDHGANIATHIIAAHGYIMAYKNTTKANMIINSLPQTPAINLTRSFIACYEELAKNNMAPPSTDWNVVVSMCAAAAFGKQKLNKWQILNNSERTPWHYELRPWKYPRHLIEVKEEYRFLQRGQF